MPPAGNNCRAGAYLGALGEAAPIAKRGSRSKLPSNMPPEKPCPVSPLQPPFALCAAAIGALADCRLRRCALARRRRRRDHPRPATGRAGRPSGIQTAVIAGGCFWGVQGVFQHTAGVVNAVSGYAGGSRRPPTTTWSSTGATGHAGIGRDQIRPDEDQLRQDPADLLLGGARPDPVEPPGPGHAARNTARRSSPPLTSRRRWRRPISPSSTPPKSTGSRS